MWRQFSQSLTVVLLAVAYRFWTLFWSMEHVRHPATEKGRPVLYAHWHGDELLLIGAYRHSRMAIMASKSRDGEIQARFLKGLGYHVVRGSSSKGGAIALRGLVEAVTKEGWNASLAVDGPRGPIYRAKLGILKLAQLTGCDIIPGAAAASRRFIFKKAWNRAFLPAPFAKCVVVYCDPIQVPKDASDDDLERLRIRLEAALISLKVEAEKIFDRPFQAVPQTSL